MSVLKADRVSKYFGHFPALRDLTFSFEAGDCVALLGRNGAGKTTLLHLMAGLSRPTDGQLDVARRVSLLGHGIGVYDELSARENLQFFAGLAQRPVDVEDWLDRVHLRDVAGAPLREYSRGMRQRLALARTFLGEPELLLLDEPFTSLDDKATALLQALLREALDRGATIVLSTHQIPEAMALATKVLFLENGRLRFFGARPEQMLGDSTWIYRTYGATS